MTFVDPALRRACAQPPVNNPLLQLSATPLRFSFILNNNGQAIMAPRKASASAHNGDVVAPVAVVLPQSTSRLPGALRFPLLALLSLTLSALMYTFAAEFTGRETAQISRSTEDPTLVLGLLGWRVVELGLCWFYDFDGEELLHGSMTTWNIY